MRDFPLKITGGATAAKTQKAMWNCTDKKEEHKWVFKDTLNVERKSNKRMQKLYQVAQEKPPELQSTVSLVMV